MTRSLIDTTVSLRYKSHMRWLAIAVGVCGCGKSDKSTGGAAAGAPSSPAKTGAAPAGVADALAALLKNSNNLCALMPKATIARMVPDAARFAAEPYGCMAYGKGGGAGISVDVGPAPEGHDTDLGASSSIERSDPHNKGDVFLRISLGNDSNATNHNLNVTVTRQDGNDHKDDAIEIAKEVIAQLH